MIRGLSVLRFLTLHVGVVEGRAFATLDREPGQVRKEAAISDHPAGAEIPGPLQHPRAYFGLQISDSGLMFKLGRAPATNPHSAIRIPQSICPNTLS